MMDHRDFTASEIAAATAMTGVGDPPTASEVAAAADDTTPRPLRAVATPEGDVHIIVDPATARYLATAWSTFHADSPHVRDWPADVIQLVTAAAHADLEAGRAHVIRRGFTVHPIPGGVS